MIEMHWNLMDFALKTPKFSNWSFSATNRSYSGNRSIGNVQNSVSYCFLSSKNVSLHFSMEKIDFEPSDHHSSYLTKHLAFSQKVTLGYFGIGYLHEYWSDEVEPYSFEKF